MKTALLLYLITLAAASDPAAPPAAEVDVAAVKRMGNVVQHLGDGANAEDETDEYVEAMGPPPTDDHKFFLSIVGREDCAPCIRLRAQWTAAAERAGAAAPPQPGDELLLAWGNPIDGEKSWAHLNFYDVADDSQKWRFKDVEIKTFPTIILQPPRNKSYGDPATVIYLAPYPGDPAKLSDALGLALRRYLAKRRAAAEPAPAPVRGFGQLVGPPSFRVSPPWSPVATPPPTTTDEGIFPPTIPPSATPVAPAAPPAEADELVVVSDGAGDVLADPRIKRAVEAIGRGGKLRTRLTDYADAVKWLPIDRNELPAVLRLQSGRVTDKLSSDVLDLLDPTFPYASVVSFLAALFSGGFTWLAVGVLAVALWRWWRTKRAAAGQPTLTAAAAAEIERLIETYLARK